MRLIGVNSVLTVSNILHSQLIYQVLQAKNKIINTFEFSVLFDLIGRT